MKHRIISAILSLFAASVSFPQIHDQGSYPDTIRGEVWIEFEPIYGGFIDDEYPLDMRTAALRALEESAMFFSAMIYGWSFYYDIGERARGIEENFELTPVAMIPFGDSGLRVTEVEVKNLAVRMWADYYLTEAQQRRLGAWRTGNIRSAQAVGYWLPGQPSTWLEVKKIAMEDAARAAVRAMLQGSERNRPKEARGFISLAAFPNYYVDAGRWAASARFRVEITEIIPFAVH
jgi:hypothetical protein